jgi:hypothetical protein
MIAVRSPAPRSARLTIWAVRDDLFGGKTRGYLVSTFDRVTDNFGLVRKFARPARPRFSALVLAAFTRLFLQLLDYGDAFIERA